MSKSAVFKNGIDISGALDVSGNMTILGILDVSATLNLHGVDIPSLPIDLCGQLLAVDNSGIGLEWIKSDAVGGSSEDTSGFYENATINTTTSTLNNAKSGFYKSLLTTLGISINE
jgi:hypothetical protein